MFEVGWTEMLVIAVVMIVVVGPKDLPRMLRTIGKMTAKMRGMAGDFQRQFNDALKEAELDDVKKSVQSLRDMNPVNQIKKELNPFEKAAADIRSGLDQAMKPKPAPAPTAASPTAVAEAAEPIKTGAANLPGEKPAEPANGVPEAAPVAEVPATPAAPVAAQANGAHKPEATK